MFARNDGDGKAGAQGPNLSQAQIKWYASDLQAFLNGNPELAAYQPYLIRVVPHKASKGEPGLALLVQFLPDLERYCGQATEQKQLALAELIKKRGWYTVANDMPLSPVIRGDWERVKAISLAQIHRAFDHPGVRVYGGRAVEEARFPLMTEIIRRAYFKYAQLFQEEPAIFSALFRTERTLVLTPRCSSSGRVEIAMFASLISQDWKSGQSVSEASILYLGTKDCLDQQMAAALAAGQRPDPEVCRVDSRYQIDLPRRLHWINSTYPIDPRRRTQTTMRNVVDEIIRDFKRAVYELVGAQNPRTI